MYNLNGIVSQHHNQPVEIILNGSREELTQMMEILPVMRFVEICEWCPRVQGKPEGNLITLINRNKR